MIAVYGIEAQLNPIKARLSNIIQATLTQVIGLPEDKRAHRFFPMNAEDFYYPDGRTDAYTVIEINMMTGREIATKKMLIKALFENIERELNIKPINIEITIKEQPAHCWGFRDITGDEAQDLKYKVN
ncbi:tautomerase family protein [Pseudoalteromonas luteoviolacea]|nr:tautomerase family protein [Pseudoalteromonas luteoviolacea]